jgi:hypothetical protein
VSEHDAKKQNETSVENRGKAGDPGLRKRETK